MSSTFISPSRTFVAMSLTAVTISALPLYAMQTLIV